MLPPATKNTTPCAVTITFISSFVAMRQFLLYIKDHIQTTSVSFCTTVVVHRSITNTFAAINGYYRKYIFAG